MARGRRGPKRKVVKYQRMRVRLKAGQTSLSSRQKNQIHLLETQRGGRKPLSTSDRCIIFFSKDGRAVQRCEGRTINKAALKARGRAVARRNCRRGGSGWKAKMRGQVRAGRKPTAQLFTRC
ncbi:MAG: hypothetical protein JSV86_17190 [Gemmatimonadota bacterium]|nr:MAG: hypothetical protein JSV86_17190 [Gemmatimonadota bacterium]